MFDSRGQRVSLTNPPRTVQVPAKHKDKAAAALQAALHVNGIFIHSAGANLIHRLWTAGIYLCMWSVQASAVEKLPIVLVLK